MSRPDVAPPTPTVQLTLQGLTEDAGGRKFYAEYASFSLRRGEPAHFELATPVTFIAQSVHAELLYREPSSAEAKFARLVVNIVPDDVWDACVAAFEASNNGGNQIAEDIFRRWLTDANYVVDENA